MSGLVEFLLARVAEDEAVARAARGERWAVHRADLGHADAADVAMADSGDQYGPEYVTLDRDGVGSTTLRDAEHIARHDPARVLAECEAKRRIVARHRRCGTGTGPCDEYDGLPCDLAHLAAVYAEHPDFREEWRQRPGE